MRYCVGCKKKHEIQDGFVWQQTKGGVNYCKKHIECVGCGTVHERTPYLKYATKVHMDTGEKLSGWWCEKWVRPATPSLQQKMNNLSPGEVMSGVHLGMDYQRDIYGSTSNQEDHSVEHSRQVQQLSEALDNA